MHVFFYDLRNTQKESVIDQGLISSVQALLFDLAKPTYQKRFDCRKAILRSSATFLGTSFGHIVVAVFSVSYAIFIHTLRS